MYNRENFTKVGSSMSLKDAEDFIAYVTKKFGYTEIATTRANGTIKFIDVSIKLKVH